MLEVGRKGSIGRVLVIGGAGYVGSVLCRQLLAHGYSVRILDLLLYGRESVSELEGEPGLELIQGDWRNLSSLGPAVSGVDAVIHLGGLVVDPACDVDEDSTLQISLASTLMLADAARGHGVKRLICASSCSVYGESEAPVDERSALNPLTRSARTRIASEMALLEFDGLDFHPVILRLATVYGISHRPRFDLVVNFLTAKAFREGRITVFNGAQWRPFVHVLDVSRAVVRCLEAPPELVKGQVFNVGSDEQNFTIQQIGEMVHRHVPGSRFLSNRGVGGWRSCRVRFAKIHGRLGYGCRLDVESGIREVLWALRDGRVGDHRLARYRNLRVGHGRLMRGHTLDRTRPVAALVTGGDSPW